jgi:hypothetical protein
MRIKAPQLVASHPQQRLLSASGKPPCLTSISTTPSMPSHLTYFPSSCAGPGASPELRATLQAVGPPTSPSLSSDAIDCTGELRISIARPLTATWCSQPCQASAPWSMDDAHVHLPTNRPAVGCFHPCHTAHRHRVLRAMWTSMCCSSDHAGPSNAL